MESNKDQTITIITGPTSSGKTSLALELCKKINGIIISADSRQIYKYMDIGTGKLPLRETYHVEKKAGSWKMDGVEIYGYDLVNPGEYFSAVDFREFALNRIEEERLGKNRKILVVGGTGFYTDVLTGIKTVSHVKPDLKLRSALNEKDLPTLLSQLSSLNKNVYDKIDKQNKVRVIRALEIELHKTVFPTPLPSNNFNFEYIGLFSSRENLYSRADLWVENIWKSGLIEEYINIKNKFGEVHQLNGLIYKNVRSYIDHDLSLSEAIQTCKYDIHAYIRRQQTWFKKNDKINWVELGENLEDKVLDRLL